MIRLRFAVAAADPGGAVTADNDDNGDDDEYGGPEIDFIFGKIDLIVW